MPKDHSCLFHAICYGLKLQYDGHILRRKLFEYVTANPAAYDNIKDYYDNYSHKEYGIVMNHKDYWGGPPELQLISQKFKCNLYVYIETKMKKDEPFSDSKYTRVASYEYTNKSDSQGNVQLLLENYNHYCVLNDCVVMEKTSILPKGCESQKHSQGTLRAKAVKRAWDQLSVCDIISILKFSINQSSLFIY
jgi:hypothetical protein